MSTFFDDEIFDVNNDINQSILDLGKYYNYDILILISGWTEENKNFFRFLKSNYDGRYGFVNYVHNFKSEKEQIFWIKSGSINGSIVEKELLDILKYCPLLNISVFCKEKESEKLTPVFKSQVKKSNSEQFFTQLLEKTKGISNNNIKLDEDIDYIFSDISFDNTYWEYVSSILAKAKESYQNYYPSLDSLDLKFFHRVADRDLCPLPIITKDGFVSYNESWKDIECENEELEKYIPKGNILGYYTHWNEKECEGPHICLYTEAIEEEANSAQIDIKLLYAIVIIHELAHAMMDNNLDDSTLPKTLYAKAMEESLANCIVLKLFHDFDLDNYEKVREWISKRQPIIYRFGINQYDADVDWTKWRNSNKDKMSALIGWFDCALRKVKS